MSVQLSTDQYSALEEIVERLSRGDRLVTLGGYAGVGKTTLIAEIVPILRDKGFKRIAFATFTGKAKDVLRSKLTAKGTLLPEVDYCGTLHGLLYNARQRMVDDGKGHTRLEYTFSKRLDGEGVDLIVIDEASMVSEEIFKDVEALGVPILAVGDHGQLPPVKSSFNLMGKPMVRLEKIHRQAEGSPIIRMSRHAREEGEIPVGQYGPGVLKTTNDAALYNLARPWEHLLLCGTNRLRGQLNNWMRGKLGYKGEPRPGEQIICLKNNRNAQVMNGMLGELKTLSAHGDHWWDVEVEMDTGVTFNGPVLKYQFGAEKTLDSSREARGVDPREFKDLFDYGYALTVWKAQGSEAENVVFFEEGAIRYVLAKQGPDGWRRFLYTAVTRARTGLIVLGGQ